MIVLGLTGGIASGKSFVARLLAERGAVICDADRHAHAALLDPKVHDAVVARWGADVANSDGSLSRRAIAARVFGPDDAATAERRFLEGLVHPWVRERLRADLDAARAAGAPAAVLDVPLLVESGWANECDAVLFVDTPDDVRRGRAAARGWTPEEFARREASQAPIDVKRARARRVVPGDSEAAAAAGVARVWNELFPGDAL